jgi:hypothetical protein
MMNINPDTSSNEASSLTKPASKPATQVGKAGSTLAKAGASISANAKAAGQGASVIPMQPIESRHKGGPIMKDGVYRLKAGEHVLTEDETHQARKHAIMASGIKSLAEPGPKAKK